MLRQASIKTDNPLMDFSDSSWQDCPENAELQESIFYFIKLGRFTMVHMFQYQFLNQVQKVSTIQHALWEWI